jgi:trehalose-6-phosphatase
LEQHVWSQTAQLWIQSYLASLEHAGHELDRRQIDPLPQLDRDITRSDYRAASRRLILLDLKSILVDHEPAYESGAFDVNKPTIEVLLALQADRKNMVYVVSGHSTRFMDMLEKEVPGIGLMYVAFDSALCLDRLFTKFVCGGSAENGCWVRYASTKDWKNMIPLDKQTWRGPVLETLQYYTVRTPGSVSFV